jgi:hypothetical protein
MLRCLVPAAALAAACAPPETYPEGLDPLDAEHQAEAPGPSGSESHPETLNLVTGRVEDGETTYDWAHATGYVHAGMLPTWDALAEPDVGVDRRAVDSWSVEAGTAPEFAVSHTVTNYVTDDVFDVSVYFPIAWRQDIARGTDELPTAIAGRWDKTESDDALGNAAVLLLSGFFVLVYTEPEISEIQLQFHIESADIERNDADRVMQDFYDSVVACVHDAGLPSYE